MNQAGMLPEMATRLKNESCQR